MPHLHNTVDNIKQTLRTVAGRRPAIAPVLQSFEPLFVARQNVADELTELFKNSEIVIPSFDEERSKAGVPLLAETIPPVWSIKYAAEKILPELAKLPAIAEHMEALEKFFHAPAKAEDPREALAKALLAGNSMDNIQSGIPVPILDFVSQFIYSPVLRAMSSFVNKENNEYPWDREGAWKEGYCPFCGSFPVIAWLDKQTFDVKNTFLASGGGKKHYHCSLCGSSWKFRRGVCPACGKEGEDTVNILNVKGYGSERIDWCGHCKSYCPTVDLRELAGFPNMDALALGMMHLDMVAASKKLHPLKFSFWNIF